MGDVRQVTSNYEPRAWQTTLHELMVTTRFVVCIVHRRGGKTVAAVNSLILHALATPGTRYGYVAPTRTQAKRITWALFKEYCTGLPCEFRESELTIRFANGSEIALYSGEDHDAMRGIGLHGVVIDEIANMPFDAWHGSIRPTLSDTNGWALFIGTPRGQDLLSELALYAQDGSDPEWAFVNFPAWPENTTGVLPDAEIEAARRSMPESQFLREYGTRLDVSAEDALIKAKHCIAAQRRAVPATLAKKLNQFARVMGVDVGHTGDKTVFAYRNGPVALEPTFLALDQQKQIAQALAAKIVEFEPDAVFIDSTGGWGLGVIEEIQLLGHYVVPVNFGARALMPDRYPNRRNEMYDGLKRWVEQPNAVLPPGQHIVADLAAAQYTVDAQNRVKLESKSDVRKRLGRSPDFADALALTFAAPVHPSRATTAHNGRATFERGADGSKYYSQGRNVKRQSLYTEYDPWS